jgi:hypothetical protein
MSHTDDLQKLLDNLKALNGAQGQATSTSYFQTESFGAQSNSSSTISPFTALSNVSFSSNVMDKELRQLMSPNHPSSCTKQTIMRQ